MDNIRLTFPTLRGCVALLLFAGWLGELLMTSEVCGQTPETVPDSALKSVPGTEPVRVTIKNAASSPADGFWIDFEGVARYYFTLDSGGEAVIETGRQHVWQFYVDDALAETFTADDKTDVLTIRPRAVTGPLRLLLPKELVIEGPERIPIERLATQSEHGTAWRTFVGRPGRLPINSLQVTPKIRLTSRSRTPEQQAERARLLSELRKLYEPLTSYRAEIVENQDGLEREQVEITFPTLELDQEWKLVSGGKPPLRVRPTRPGIPALPALELPWLSPELETSFQLAFHSQLIAAQKARVGALEFEFESSFDVLRAAQVVESPQRRIAFIRISPELLTWNQLAPEKSPLTSVNLQLKQADRTLNFDFAPRKFDEKQEQWSAPRSICWAVQRPDFDQDPPVTIHVRFTFADGKTRIWPESGKNFFQISGPDFNLELVDFDWIYEPPAYPVTAEWFRPNRPVLTQYQVPSFPTFGVAMP